MRPEVNPYYQIAIDSGMTGSPYVGAYLPHGGRFTNGSSDDTSTLISGELYGVEVAGGPGTIVNFGEIRSEWWKAGYLVGTAIDLEAGGSVVNGSPTDRTARIDGVSGIKVLDGTGTVRNYGTIVAMDSYAHGDTLPSPVVGLAYGGSIINGGVGDRTALLQGQVELNNWSNQDHSAVVTNFGTILGFESNGENGNSGAMPSWLAQPER